MRRDLRTALGFCVAFGLLLSLAMTLVWRGYINEAALRLWADVLMTWETRGFASERLTLLYPQLRFYLALLFYPFTALRSWASLYTLSAIVATGLLAAWYALVFRATRHAVLSFACTLVLATHPFFLWSATRGGVEAVNLLGATALAVALGYMMRAPVFRGAILLAGTLAAYLILDERFPYLAVALLPLLALFAPPQIMSRSVTAFYLITLMPLAAVVLSYLYVNWLFAGGALAFAEDPNSVFHGARAQTQTTPWLLSFGGGFVSPLVVGCALAFASAPAPLAALAWHRRIPERARPLAVTYAVPILALALATMNNFAAHAVEFLQLLLVPTVLAFTTAGQAPRRLAFLLALAVLGHVGAWASVHAWPSDDLRRWTGALTGNLTDAGSFEPERAFLAWIEGREGIMLDDRLGFPLIAGLGTARPFVLPAEPGFKEATVIGRLVAPMVAVPDPRREGATGDQLNQNFPGLYDGGAAGYRLAYDRLGWRVYERTRPARLLGRSP
ncbi:MAG: hypothetical protein ACE5Q3_09265 [Alphaproteobacteria bacterium]